jgi:DNA-binding IclR family transcriptional regulator
MIFLALEQRPCNVANLARQTGLSENRVKNLLEYLRRKKAIRILGRRERKYTAIHGRGIFYATARVA